MENRRVSLTRIYHFSASHRLVSPFLTESENLKTYGKCGHPAGHGHNYTLAVTVRGHVNPETGGIISLPLLDETVNREVLEPFDHKNLNIELKDADILTSEILISEIWNRLQPCFNDVELHKIEVRETRKNSFAYYG